MDDDMLELKQEFLSEAFELLSLMEEKVLELEQNKEATESVNAIFRVAHTLKGGAAALELERIAVFTHNLENLLDLVRDAKLAVDEEIIDIVLQSLDILNALVKAAATNTEAAAGIELETLEKIKRKSSGGSAPVTPVVPAVAVAPVIAPPASEPMINPVVESSHSVKEAELDDESFKEILMDEFGIGTTETAQITQALAQSHHLGLIHVHLDDSNEMKSVSGIQTITAIRGLGTLVAASPSIPEIMETEFIEHLQFLLLTKEPKDRIFGKIYLSDVTKDVEISDISNMFGKVSEKTSTVQQVRSHDFTNPLDQIPEIDFLSHQAAMQNALEGGGSIFNIRVLINEDAPMRDVDSLLVITSLEEIGDVIYSQPTKRDLYGNTYYPVIDILLHTHENKEIVKEKAFIKDITLEIRASEIKLKDELSSEADTIAKESISMPPTVAVEQPVPLSVSEEVNIPPATVSTEKTSEDSSKVVEKPMEEIHLSRFTSKEEARVRGFKTADTAVVQKTFLKVDSTRVDSLLNLVSELVISKAALTQITATAGGEFSELRMSVADIQALLLDIAAKNPSADRDSLRKIHNFLEAAHNSWRGIDIFDVTVNRVSRSINELQEGITKIRMVPIGTVFNRFPRMIRDLSRQLGKKIRLDIYGEDTELDKTIIEELADPLIHMIRNSVDHGIEMPDIRSGKKKNEEGRIILRAVHEGTMIRIEIEDDGAGLDSQRIFRKAVEKGLISANQNLSIEEANQLILLPGFSTAEKVTDLSGRGVGMDVVRRNIEDLSGKLYIESEFGKGSKFVIKIPLTLSIIQALVFQVKGFYYAVPLSVISETVPLKKNDMHIFESSEVITINGNLISVIDIGKVFNIKETREDKQKNLASQNSHEMLSTELLDESLKILDRVKFRDSANTEKDFFTLDTHQIEKEEDINETHKYLIVVQAGNKKVGLLVDNIISEQDIVIKPLDKRYATSRGISGATILGDGSISLIIDIAQMVDLYLNKDNIVTL